VDHTADEFFHKLRSAWISVPPGIRDSFLRENQAFLDLELALRDKPSLRKYDEEIYPELAKLFQWPLPSQEGSADPVVVTHFCNQQLQVMENAFYALNLATYHAHPLNRGWMNLFRRWTSTETLRRAWSNLRSLYSVEFVQFAEYQLNLPPVAERARTILYRRQVAEPSIDAKVVPTLNEHLSREKLKIEEFPSGWVTLLTEAKNAIAHRRPCRFPPSGLQRVFEELTQEWAPTKYEEFYAPFLNPWVFAVISDPELPAPQHPVPSDAAIWGIGALAPHSISHTRSQNKRIRLLVWIRPSYRGSGLGTRLLDALLNVCSDQLRAQLLVLLPPLPRDRPGYGEEMAGWLRFYGRRELVRRRSQEAERVSGWQQLPPDAFCLTLPDRTLTSDPNERE